MKDRLAAADVFARALRVCESATARATARRLCEAVVFKVGGAEIVGRDLVEARLREVWPFTPVLAKGVWTPAELIDGVVHVRANFDKLGAAPRNYRLTFWFDQRDNISRVEESFEFPTQANRNNKLPLHVRSAIDRALADGHPMTVAYVTGDGSPALSLRGSIQVWDDMQLCAWIRNPNGGLADAARSGAIVSMLYRDSSTRTTMIITARARLVEDEASRRAIFDRIPEVEQTHDPNRTGAAVVFDIERLIGTHPLGPLLVERAT
jgi:hypothetical protein